MKFYLCLLVLCITVGVKAGQQQQPSPVYRSAPTVLKQQPQPQPRLEQPAGLSQPGTPQNSFSIAEEREGQHGNAEAASSSNSKMSGGPAVSGVQQQPQAAGSPVKSSQEYTVMYVPQPQRELYSTYLQQPGVQGAYPQAGQVTPLTAYQSPAGANGQVAAAPASDIWSSINWRDTGVALACLALVGAGSAMWYPRLAHLKARAMRELSDLKAEDAGRMARSVMRAIQKFSELNNRNTAE